jgi:hypothetical protein
MHRTLFPFFDYSLIVSRNFVRYAHRRTARTNSANWKGIVWLRPGGLTKGGFTEGHTKAPDPRYYYGPPQVSNTVLLEVTLWA